MVRRLWWRIRQDLRREAFHPSWRSLFIHPFYIIRSGLRRHVRELAPNVTGRVLDLGCGSRPYEVFFTGAREYIGVDVEQSGHDHVNSRVDVFYDGKRLPFEDCSFDAVVSFETFEHIFNLDEILEEIKRVTRPGGRLLVSLPFAWGEHEQPYDCARYTSFGLRWKLAEHGFRAIDMRKTTSFVPALAQMWASYLHQHVAPANAIAKAVFQLVVIAPVTLLGVALGRVLPRRYDYYCNLVALAQKDATVSVEEALEWPSPAEARAAAPGE